MAAEKDVTRTRPTEDRKALIPLVTALGRRGVTDVSR